MSQHQTTASQNPPVFVAWPEVVIGFLAVLEMIPLMFLGLISPYAWTPEWFMASLSLWRFPAFTLIPVWIVLRMIDWMFAGPARRKGLLIVSPLP